MDGLRHPVGEKAPGVYWVRRLIVLAVVALILVVAWFLIFSPGGEGGEPATTPTGEVTTSPNPTSTATATYACTDADVTLTATPNPVIVAAGSLPQFDVSIEHVSLTPCLLSTTAEGTSLVITSGSERIFSSLDCPDDGSFTDTELLLSEGSTELIQANWTRQRSNESCGTELATPAAGYYWAEISVQGISAEPVQFQLAE